jgi:hypothetical protein
VAATTHSVSVSASMLLYSAHLSCLLAVRECRCIHDCMACEGVKELTCRVQFIEPIDSKTVTVCLLHLACKPSL